MVSTEIMLGPNAMADEPTATMALMDIFIIFTKIRTHWQNHLR